VEAGESIVLTPVVTGNILWVLGEELDVSGIDHFEERIRRLAMDWMSVEMVKRVREEFWCDIPAEMPTAFLYIGELR
jgi:hypothetical protein